MDQINRNSPLVILLIVSVAVFISIIFVYTGIMQCSEAAILISSIAVILNAVSLGFVMEKYNQEKK